jgi:hypothetical protein
MEFTIVELLAGAILFGMTIISVYCSSMLLYIVSGMPKWNGYLVLVFSMTVCELIYDSTFFLMLGYHNRYVFHVISFLFGFGGLSVAFWSNILSGILLYLVTVFTPMDIWKHYWKFFCICIFPTFVFAIFDSVYCYDTEAIESYNIIRFMSILFNILVYLIITRKFRMLGSSKTSKSVGPLKELASRFKFYPIAQVVCRIPVTIYQLSYGFSYSGFQAVKLDHVSQVVALFLYALSAPSCGIAYFVVFLYMQPQASEEYRKIRLRWWNNCISLFPGALCCCFLPLAEADSLTTDQSNSSVSNSTVFTNNGSPGAVGIDGKALPLPRKPSLGRYGRQGLASDELINPLTFDRNDTESEYNVGGVTLRADNCWRHYRAMDEDELVANIRESEGI